MSLITTSRIPIDEADFSNMAADSIETCIARYGWPDGSIDPLLVESYARQHPAQLAGSTELASLRSLSSHRRDAQEALAKVDEAWQAEIREAYRAGATANEIAIAIDMSIARVYQLTAGTRKYRRQG